MSKTTSGSIKVARLSSQNKQRKTAKFVIYVSLTILAIIFSLPLIWLVSSSLKTIQQVGAYPPIWIPDPIKWNNFYHAVTEIPFARYFLNTSIITIGSIVGTVLSCTLVAYGFARIQFYGRNFWFMVMLATLMLPGTVTLIPRFLIFNELGWINTYLPLILPNFLGSAFFIFLMRQFFKGISEQLTDAARIDGCTELGILFRIVIPLSGPAIAVMAILTFQQEWNDFMGPLIYLNSADMKTLAVGLYDFMAFEGVTFWNYMMAATLLMIVPVILLFAFFQQYFIQGIVLTGGKD